MYTINDALSVKNAALRAIQRRELDHAERSLEWRQAGDLLSANMEARIEEVLYEVWCEVSELPVGLVGCGGQR